MVTGTSLVLEVIPALELLPYFDNDGYWNQIHVPHLTMPKKYKVILIMMVTATGTNFELLSYFDNDGHWDQL